MYSNQKLNWETGEFDTSYLSNNYCYFELIEDNNIDIDCIEEITIGDIANIDGMANERIKNKFNQLVQAVKQLNKEIKEVKEK